MSGHRSPTLALSSSSIRHSGLAHLSSHRRILFRTDTERHLSPVKVEPHRHAQEQGKGKRAQYSQPLLVGMCHPATHLLRDFFLAEMVSGGGGDHPIADVHCPDEKETRFIPEQILTIMYRAVRTVAVERTRTTTRSVSSSSRRKAKSMRRS